MRYVWVGLCAVAALAAGVWLPRVGQQPALGADKDSEAAVKHGGYLVSRVAMCGDCHTPQDKKGKPDHDRLLQGAPLPIEPKKKTDDWADHSPDITGGGLAGKWSE